MHGTGRVAEGIIQQRMLEKIFGIGWKDGSAYGGDIIGFLSLQSLVDEFINAWLSVNPKE